MFSTAFRRYTHVSPSMISPAVTACSPSLPAALSPASPCRYTPTPAASKGSMPDVYKRQLSDSLMKLSYNINRYSKENDRRLK